MKKKYWSLLLVFAVFANVSPVLADGDFYVVAVGGGVGTPVTSVPYTITQPGFYYLKGNLTAPANVNAITIHAHNVTIDLMGFSLSGLNTGNGIYSSGYTNLEVRNGTLTQFDSGIAFTSATDCRFINIRTMANASGIHGNGSDILIKGCSSSGNGNYGIVVNGSATISGNALMNNKSYGILINGYGIISGNLVYNSNYSITIQGDGSIIGNSVKTNGTGIWLSGGVGNYVMLDQNTACGTGTHFNGGSVVYTKGTNAGF